MFYDFFGYISDYIVNWWTSSFNFSDAISSYKSTINIILYFFGILLAYRTIYAIIGFFCKGRTYPAANEEKTYACIICARNEELVIGNLIESINKQTYNKEKVKIFVCSDNSTDKTAEISRNLGAIVYERFDLEHVSKGYALEYLFNKIKEDYTIEAFDYYLIFDADNLIKTDFIEQMNNAFVYGNYDMVTSFRNIKNFSSNFVSASYGIHFYRNTMCSHRPRNIIKSSTHLTGTGYGFKNEIVKDGWHYICLTEDTELTTISIANNLTIGYCEAAEIYDEQPTKLSQSFRQRIRWAKGRWLNFIHNGYKLLTRIFKGHFWSKYDTYMYIFPYDLLSFVLSISLQAFILIYSLVAFGSYDTFIFLKYFGGFLLGVYLSSVFIGLLVMIKERKKIKCNIFKKIFYILVWPWFDMLSVFFTLIAIFKPVKWKPIIHDDKTTIEDLENK